MTCAHVVNAGLKKVAGVESVEVSLNKGLATVKLKAGNTVKLQDLWKLIHSMGYTPKTTAVVVRGLITGSATQPKLKVTGTADELSLTGAAKGLKPGATVVLRGAMTPLKDLAAAVPLDVKGVQ